MARLGNRKFSYYRARCRPRFRELYGGLRGSIVLDRETVEITGLTHTHDYGSEDELRFFGGARTFEPK